MRNAEVIRQWQILREIETRRTGVTIHELAAQVDVSTRTIRRDLQARLAAEGYSVRVYVPFGTHWYPYFMRRLAERPANLWFVVRNLIR